MDFDRSALKALIEAIGDDPEDLLELISTFLEEAPELVSVLATARSDEERQLALRAAHTLKSGARDFGASRLGPLCERLEERLRAGARLPDVSELMDEVVSAWPPFAQALSHEARVLEHRL